MVFNVSAVHVLVHWVERRGVRIFAAMWALVGCGSVVSTCVGSDCWLLSCTSLLWPASFVQLNGYCAQLCLLTW